MVLDAEVNRKIETVQLQVHEIWNKVKNALRTMNESLVLTKTAAENSKHYWTPVSSKQSKVREIEKAYEMLSDVINFNKLDDTKGTFEKELPTILAIWFEMEPESSISQMAKCSAEYSGELWVKK